MNQFGNKIIMKQLNKVKTKLFIGTTVFALKYQTTHEHFILKDKNSYQFRKKKLLKMLEREKRYAYIVRKWYINILTHGVS